MLYKSDPSQRPLEVPKDVLLDGCDATAGQLHGRVVKLHLGTGVEVVDARSVGGQLADGGDFDRSLVLVPLLRLGLGRWVVSGGGLGLLGHLLRVLDHGLLLDGGGVVHGVRVFLRAVVCVETVANVGALAGDGGKGRAASDGGRHALGGIGHLDDVARALALAAGNLKGRVDVGVHGGDARVALLDHVEGMLDGLAALEHDGMMLNRVLGDVLHVVLVHLLVEVGERGSAVHNVVALGHGLAGHNGRDGPGHGRLGRSRRRLAHVGVGGAVVHDLMGVQAALVRAALVLDHGGFAAEALDAAVVGAFVGALAGVDAAMAGKRGGLERVLAGGCGCRIGRVSYVREALAAAHVLALMRLLASVSSDVNSQGAALDEALATTGNRARVRALVGVDSVVALKIRLAVEALLRPEWSAMMR